MKSIKGKYIGNIYTIDDEEGRWITIKGTHVFIKKGESVESGAKRAIQRWKDPKKAVLRRAKEVGKGERPLTKAQKKEKEKKEKEEAKKKKQPTRRAISPEEKRRKEIEAQAKRTKKPKELPEREKAIKKLIEETGHERKRAEEIIDKRMGKEEKKETKKEVPKKKIKEKVEPKISKKLGQKQKQLNSKVQKLQQLNKKKYKSELLGALLAMIIDYISTGNKNTSQFANAIIKFSKSKKIDAEKKKKMLREIKKLRNEVQTFYNSSDKDPKMKEKVREADLENKFKRKDMTVDYPVSSYTKKSGVKVKAHERGEGKKEYPGRLIKTTKSGRRYIEFADNDEIQGSTAKAIRVRGIWLPRSQIISDDKKGGYIYVAEWLFKEKQRELVLKEIGKLNRYIQEEKEDIRKEEKLINMDPSDPLIRFSGMTKEDREKRIKNLNESIKKLEVRIKFEEKKLKSFDFTEDLTHDFISEMNDITLDFYDEKGDFTILHGPITRDGAFEYEKNGVKVLYYKDWKNIKEVFKNRDYIPLKASIEQGSHHAKILGYATNWKPNEKTRQMFADVVLFNDIAELTDLHNPEGGYQVSIGFKDRIEDNIQWLVYVDHLAMSLSNKDTGRCLTANGKSCYAKMKN